MPCGKPQPWHGLQLLQRTVDRPTLARLFDCSLLLFDQSVHVRVRITISVGLGWRGDGGRDAGVPLPPWRGNDCWYGWSSSRIRLAACLPPPRTLPLRFWQFCNCCWTLQCACHLDHRTRYLSTLQAAASLHSRPVPTGEGANQ